MVGSINKNYFRYAKKKQPMHWNLEMVRGRGGVGWGGMGWGVVEWVAEKGKITLDSRRKGGVRYAKVHIHRN